MGDANLIKKGEALEKKGDPEEAEAGEGTVEKAYSYGLYSHCQILLWPV